MPVSQDLSRSEANLEKNATTWNPEKQAYAHQTTLIGAVIAESEFFRFCGRGSQDSEEIR
jgi:hypothetical protein